MHVLGIRKTRYYSVIIFDVRDVHAKQQSKKELLYRVFIVKKIKFQIINFAIFFFKKIDFTKVHLSRWVVADPTFAYL